MRRVFQVKLSGAMLCGVMLHQAALAQENLRSELLADEALSTQTRALIEAMAGESTDAELSRWIPILRQLLADGRAPLATVVAEDIPLDAALGWELHYLTAYTYEQNWQSERAIQHYQVSQSARPDYLPGWLRLATHAQQLDRGDLFAHAIAAAEAMDSGSAYVFYLRGVQALRDQHWLRALKLLEKAVIAQPGANSIYRLMAQAASQAGNKQQAQAFLGRAGPIQPALNDPYIADLTAQSNSVAVLSEAGGKALESGYLDMARRLLERALSLGGTVIPEVPFNLALVYQQQGHIDRAIETLQSAIEQAPDHVNAHIQLGVLLAKQGQVEPAQAAYEAALSLDRERYPARVNLGNLLLRNGEFEKAQEQFQWLIDHHPDDRVGYIGAAQCADGQGDLTQLARVLEKAATAFARDAVLFEYRLRYLASESPDLLDPATVELAQQLYRQNPTAETMETLAMVMAARGAFEQATALMERRRQVLLRQSRQPDAWSAMLARRFQHGQAAPRPGITMRQPEKE